jgi:hypothetical protein
LVRDADDGQRMSELEGAMYAKVRQFMIDYWKASASLAGHDSSGGVRGDGLSVAFGGQRVRPDVFGIIAVDGTEIPILGEGKRSIGGHSGTEAFGQALAYTNLGMLAFLFFPAAEFSNAAAASLTRMCRQFGIGLLKVPAGRAPMDPTRDIVVDLFEGDPSVVPRCIGATLAAIKELDQRQLADIYPSSLRDLLSLFGEGTAVRTALRRAFAKHWRGFRAVLEQRPYDPMVRKKVAAGPTAAVQDEYFGKFLHGLLAIGAVVPAENGFRLTTRGRAIQSASSPAELFLPTVSTLVRRHFALALVAEFEEPILRLVETIRRAGMPVSRRPYCLSKGCTDAGGGAARWFGWRDGEGVGPRVRCPSCGGRQIEPGLWGRQWLEAGECVVTIDYAVLKFAAAVGLVSAKSPQAWQGQFPGLPCTRPDGTPIKWQYIGLGSVWTGAAEPDEVGPNE